MKMLNKLTLSCLLVLVVSLAHGQSRPSVSGNATRITTLEINQVQLGNNVNGNNSELAALQQQINDNRAAIEAVEPIQGPAGVPGAPGAPGPLSGLQCEVGQLAAWNGSAWICAGMTAAAAPLSDDNCIRGIVFSSTSANFNERDLNWNVLCEDEAQQEVTLSGPFTISEVVDLSVNEIELQGFHDFSEGLIDVFLHPVGLQDSAFSNNGEFFITVSLVAQVAGGSSEVGLWVSENHPSGTTLEIRFGEDHLGTELRDCVSTGFATKPMLIGRAYFVQETLELRCISLQAIQFSEHALIEKVFSTLSDSQRSIQADTINIQFNPIGQTSLSEFNRQYDRVSFKQYAFPRFSRKLATLDQVGSRVPTWQASAHSLSYSVSPGSDLPR